MNHLLQDLRFALRLLARSPGFTIAAMAVLALGIGANTAIFSLVHELIWSPRPYAQPEQIAQLYSQDKKNPGSFRLFSYPTYRDIVADQKVFTGVLAHNMAMVGIGDGDVTRRTFAALVSSNYFSVLGVPLPQGRAFSAQEEKPGSNIPVVIASHAFWKRNGFDPSLVGKTVRINEHTFTIVGITPEHFTGTMMLFGPELYFPLGVSGLLANDSGSTARQPAERRNAHDLFLVGRLAPGQTMATATPALQTLAANLEQAFPVEQKDQTFLLGALPRLSTNTDPSKETELTVLGTLLLAMAGVVLLIACLNLANMLLARGHARRREIAIRLALGGGRTRIIRQLLTEGFVLALGGGLAGLLLAVWSAGLLVNSFTALVPMTLFFRGAANPAIFGATLAFCTFATLMFALGPALKLTHVDLIGDLKEQPGEDPATHRRRRRWLPRHPLVVAQIALSIALLCAAGLFIRGALKAASIETGFDADHTLMAEVDGSLGGYDQTQSLQLYRAIEERLGALPGARAAGISSVVPFGTTTLNKNVRRAGIDVPADVHPASAAEGRAFWARWTSTSTGYFESMGLPILRGRAFSSVEAWQTGAPLVAIIDQTLAHNLFPDGDALGQRVQWADRPPADPTAAAQPAVTIEIVGIVPSTRWHLFQDDVGGAIYVPFAQGFRSNAFFHVRPADYSAESARRLIESVRGEIRAAAAGVPLFGATTFAQHLDSSAQLWIVRAGAALFGIFGALALLLAAVGIFGVKNYAVSRRTREIGIRMALGAAPGTVERMILREGIVMTTTGLAIGLVLGLALGQVFAGMLYKVSAFDPYTFTLAPLVLATTALVACWLPARRATRISPTAALRAE